MTDGQRDVVFVTQHYPPDKGGNAARIHDVATHLTDQGWGITVLAPPPSYPPGTFERSSHRKQTESTDGVVVHRLWSWQPQTENPGMGQRLAYYLLFGIHAMVWLLWNSRRYDVVVTTTPPISTGAPGFLASLLGKSWVVDVRDRWIDASISLGYLEEGSLIERLSRRFQRLVLHRADRISVTTPALGDSLQRTYGESLGEKTILVPNGVDVSRFQTREERDRTDEYGATDPEEEEERDHIDESGERDHIDESKERAPVTASAKADGGESTVIYTGNLGSAQDLEAVIRATSQLSHDGASLQLVGGGDVESELRHLTDDLELHDSVEFTGVVPREDVPALLGQATVGVAPLKSSDELAYAMPTKVYEYMASGLPTVVTGRGEIADFVEKSGGGVHAANDPEQIARVLDELLDDDQRRQQLSERGREYVKANYDRRAIARHFSDELRQLVGDEH